MSYEQLLFSQLEVTGETTFHSIFEFKKQLKKTARVTASENVPTSMDKVVNNYGMDKV